MTDQPAPAVFELWLDASDGSIATCDGIRWPDGTATVHHRHFPGITSTHASAEAAAWAAHGKHARIVWSADQPATDARRSCCEERFGHAPNCPVDQPDPDAPAASSGTPDDQLREQIEAALRPLLSDGMPPAEGLAPAATTAVLAVRDRRMEQLTAGRETWKAKAKEIEADRDRLATALTTERDLKEGQRGLWADDARRLRAAEATLARVEALAAEYPVALDTAHILAELDTPAPHRPVYDAVRDGHCELDGEQS